jgi:hypothetical protein
MQATGTIGEAQLQNTHESAQRKRQQLGRKMVQSSANRCESIETNRDENSFPKVLPIADLSELVQDDATESKSRAARIRTENQGIMSALL